MGEIGFQNDDTITQIYEQTKRTLKRARVNNLVKWDRGQWHKYIKQASSRFPI